MCINRMLGQVIWEAWSSVSISFIVIDSFLTGYSSTVFYHGYLPPLKVAATTIPPHNTVAAFPTAYCPAHSVASFHSSTVSL